MRLLLVVLALLLIVPHVVVAQDDDDDEPDSREYGAIIDELEVKLEAEGLNERNETVDKFAIEVEALNEGKMGMASIDLSYETIRNDTSKEIGFDIHIVKIVEFEIDNKTKGHYTNESVIVQEYFTTGENIASWPKTGWIPISKNDSGVIVNGFVITTTDDVVTIRGWYSGDSRFEYGFNTVKIDIEIHNFPFLKETGTRLGMLANVETEIEVESEKDDDNDDDDNNDNDDDDASSLNIKPPSTTGAFGKFAWADEAEGNANKTYKVVAKAIRVPPEDDDDNEAEFQLYFTFMTPRDEPIIWDPQVGVVYAPQPTSRRLETVIMFYNLVLSREHHVIFADKVFYSLFC